MRICPRTQRRSMAKRCGWPAGHLYHAALDLGFREDRELLVHMPNPTSGIFGGLGLQPQGTVYTEFC